MCLKAAGMGGRSFLELYKSEELCYQLHWTTDCVCKNVTGLVLFTFESKTCVNFPMLPLI